MKDVHLYRKIWRLYFTYQLGGGLYQNFIPTFSTPKLTQRLGLTEQRTCIHFLMTNLNIHNLRIKKIINNEINNAMQTLHHKHIYMNLQGNTCCIFKIIQHAAWNISMNKIGVKTSQVPILTVESHCSLK